MNSIRYHFLSLLLLFVQPCIAQWVDVTANAPFYQWGYSSLLPPQKDTMFYAGGDGVFISSDAGLHWTPCTGLPPGGAWGLMGRGNQVYVATELGISSTTDRGASWREVARNDRFGASGIGSYGFMGPYSFIVAWDSSKIFRSNDEGATWQLAWQGDSPFGLRNFMTIGSQLFASSRNAGLMTSLDSGATWNPIGVWGGYGVTLLSVLDTSLIRWDYNELFRSDDRGLTWIKVDGRPPSGGQWVALTVSGGWLFYYHEYYGIRVSNDRGVTFRSFNEGITRRISTLCAGEGYIFAAGEGRIFRRPLSQLTAVSGVEAGQPQEFILEQNHPNPFNPLTHIGFSLPAAADVRLAISDVLGREIAVLVNARLTAGYHSVPCDASGMSAGTYFYRLSTGSFTAVKRMVILK